MYRLVAATATATRRRRRNESLRPTSCSSLLPTAHSHGIPRSVRSAQVEASVDDDAMQSRRHTTKAINHNLEWCGCLPTQPNLDFSRGISRNKRNFWPGELMDWYLLSFLLVCWVNGRSLGDHCALGMRSDS